MADTFNYGEMPDFMERLAVLAGKCGYRLPVEGRNSSMRDIPSEHAIAMALAYGRCGVNDIGPDMAFDMATNSRRYRHIVVRCVAEAIRANRKSRPISRNLPWVHLACFEAYAEIMGLPRMGKIPQSVKENDWYFLVEAAKRTMLSSAEQAVQNAEDAFYKKDLHPSQKGATLNSMMR